MTSIQIADAMKDASNQVVAQQVSHQVAADLEQALQRFKTNFPSPSTIMSDAFAFLVSLDGKTLEERKQALVDLKRENRRLHFLVSAVSVEEKD